jgi:hypothetical protein
MKRSLVLLYSFLACIYAQSQNIDSVTVTHKSIPIIQQRTFHLNGGNKATLGGGKSRVYLQIDLPPNTIEWYYSFTTSGNENIRQDLNLAVQLTALLTLYCLNPSSSLLTSSGLTRQAIASISIPAGSHAIDAYLCDGDNIGKFLNKVAFNYQMEGTTENTTEGVISVRNHDSGTWYIGLRNPAMVYSANITIEVVAITEE